MRKKRIANFINLIPFVLGFFYLLALKGVLPNLLFVLVAMILGIIFPIILVKQLLASNDSPNMIRLLDYIFLTLTIFLTIPFLYLGLEGNIKRWLQVIVMINFALILVFHFKELKDLKQLNINFLIFYAVILGF